MPSAYVLASVIELVYLPHFSHAGIAALIVPCTRSENECSTENVPSAYILASIPVLMYFTQFSHVGIAALIVPSTKM